MVHIHLVTKYFFPVGGGMERSVARIAKFLSEVRGFKSYIYVTKVEEPSGESDRIKGTYKLQKALFEPYEEASKAPFSHEAVRENNRLSFLILRNEIEKEIRKTPNDCHIIISFFLSTTGFICQHVSDNLRIPHIACIRGSDFSRDLYSTREFGLNEINWVANRASYIMTTSNDQLETLKYLFSISDNRISTVYNSIGDEFSEYTWKPKKRGVIKLICDSGFLHKKGTHVLLKSFEELINKGYPIQLSMIGKIEKDNENYWNYTIASYKERYNGSFFVYGFMKIFDVLKMFLESDVYCSPTLGEGCSSSRLQALFLGIPIVSTECGELKDIVRTYGKNNFIELCNPGDQEGFTVCLERMIDKLNKLFYVDKQYIDSIKKTFSVANEKLGWEGVIRNVVAKNNL
ncbi:MAG: glycosyltransferase family 4 protein [bacterium]